MNELGLRRAGGGNVRP